MTERLQEKILDLVIYQNLIHFGEIRLNASREEMLRAASMRLLTTYGAAPEIYESSTINDVDHFTGCFSGGLLKEAFVFQHETQCSAEKLQQDLEKKFGSPMNQIDSTGATAMPALVNPDTAKDNPTRKPLFFP